MFQHRIRALAKALVGHCLLRLGLGGVLGQLGNGELDITLAFVARFVGFENLVPMKVVARDGAKITAEAAGGVKLTLSLEHFGAIPDNFVLACRADGLAVTDNMAAEGIPTTLGLRTYLGRAYQYQSETAAGMLVANGPLSRPLEPGSNAKLVPVPDQCTILAVE